MQYKVQVFRVVFAILCLCAFGSTKSSNTFDVSKSTAIQAQDDSSLKVNTVAESQTVSFVRPPQPRNKRGRFVCTSDRYVAGERQIGEASWYGGQFHGQETSNGERFNQNAHTLAHLTLPMGTKVLIENPVTKVTLYARVNDCGPYIKGRIFDLSHRLAKDLGLLQKGTGEVIVTVL